MDKIDCKNTPIEGLKYYKKWNVPDFKGHYHVSQIKTNYPVPGSIIIDEFKHAKLKAEDVRRFEKQLSENATKHKRKEKNRVEQAAFSTRVLFNATIYDPINEAEEVTHEKQKMGKISISFICPHIYFPS